MDNFKSIFTHGVSVGTKVSISSSSLFSKCDRAISNFFGNLNFALSARTLSGNRLYCLGCTVVTKQH